jgi:hypothetical protein
MSYDENPRARISENSPALQRWDQVRFIRFESRQGRQRSRSQSLFFRPYRDSVDLPFAYPALKRWAIVVEETMCRIAVMSEAK